MRGFTAVEVLVVLALLSALYAFAFFNFDARRHTAAFEASVVQARLWADAAEVERRGGVLLPGRGDVAALLRRRAAPARTPFGGPYRVTATTHAAVVSFDAPFAAGGAGVLYLAPSVFAPTAPMREKALLYQEAVR